ncbi:MAG: trypsin-like peptidase domain-containing protein [Clostridia bacterium]|nr:trypsin-like peptidase domain-containing protein [Clostridia bacterium]
MYEYKKRPNKFKKILTLILLIIVVAATAIFIYDMYINIDVYSNEQENINNKPIRISHTEESDNLEEQNDITKILENTIKSVVGISKIKNTGSSIFLNDSTSNLGLGTGMIVSDSGYILTNWHVAGSKYSNCYVTLENGNSYNGNVVWSDEDLDLAIVKISATTLKTITLGDSDNIKIGEKTYAIGNPIGIEFQRTVTSGIISGVNRTIKIEEENSTSYMEDLIQTDATINPGNSGGPLINLKGEVIGINSIKITEAEGIGFAIPINIIKPVIENFIINGGFEEAYLGIFAYDKNIVPYIDSGVEFNSGVYIAQISADGPSHSSGLKVGDIITKIDEITVNKMSELRNYIYTKKVGDEVNLSILRNKKEYNIKIKLGKKI